MTFCCCAAGGPGGKKCEGPPQRETKGPVLRSALHGRRPISRQANEEGDSPLQTKKKKIDLIFKDVLEASLEDSKNIDSPLNSTFPLRRTRGRHASSLQPKSLATQTSLYPKEQEYKPGPAASPEGAEGGLGPSCIKLEGQNDGLGLSCPAGPSTSFCPNCVKLKRRIKELEAEVERLRAGPQAELVSHVPPQPEPPLLDEQQGRSWMDVQNPNPYNSRTGASMKEVAFVLNQIALDLLSPFSSDFSIFLFILSGNQLHDFNQSLYSNFLMDKREKYKRGNSRIVGI